MPFFFYGSLTDADVLASIIGHAPDGLAIGAARLAGWRRVRVRDAWYPMLVRSATDTVDGVVVGGLGRGDIARLSAYEGADYEVRTLSVDAVGRGRVRASVFMARPGIAASGQAWSTEAFRASVKARILARTRARPVPAGDI